MRYAVGHGHDPVVQQDEGLGIHVQVRCRFSSWMDGFGCQFSAGRLEYSLLQQLTELVYFLVWIIEWMRMSKWRELSLSSLETCRLN